MMIDVHAFLNDFQSHELKIFIREHTESEMAALEYGERADPISHIGTFKCAVPGMCAVYGEGGHVMKLLYPHEKPVNKDPLFQHAESLSRFCEIIQAKFVHGRLAFAKDFQWDGVLMDAPCSMPAGSCEYFDHDYEVYGAIQTTIDRN